MSWVRTHWWTRTAQFYYRTAFVSAALTYGIVVYKTLRARAKAGLNLTPQVAVSLLGDENVQYLRTCPCSTSHTNHVLPRLKQLTIPLLSYSHGPRVALLPLLLLRLAPLRHLLHLPLRDLHPLHRHPHHHTPHPGPCRRWR